MDSAWKGLRQQVPWVKRLPSEYIMHRGGAARRGLRGGPGSVAPMMSIIDRGE
ncbi:MAG: hypothetical protein WD118_10295 [Phycisphaeraceae bacterium]